MRVQILNIGKGETRSIILIMCFLLISNYYLMHDLIIFKLFLYNSEKKHADHGELHTLYETFEVVSYQ